MQYQVLAKELYDLLGGAGNIFSATNCMTRLRVQLVKKDEKMLSKLQTMNGVLGINDTEEELQIILGPGKAAKVADSFQEILKSAKEKPDKKQLAGLILILAGVVIYNL